MNKIKVACAVIVKDDKIFCCKRGPGRDFEGFWEFPGGKIENGEYNYQTIVREIKEELNSEVVPEITICYSKYENIEMQAELCTLVSGDLTLSEHTDSKWLTASELDSVNWAPADRAIVEEVKKMLLKQSYKLCLDKNDCKVGNIYGGWDFKYDEVKDSVEVIWEENASYVTAHRKFIDTIKKQQHEYCDLKTVTKWRVVRLYDSTGKQIAQEG